MIRAYGKSIGFPKNKAVYMLNPLFLGWGVARKFLEGFPGWLVARKHDMPWPFITEACRALWCRWRHCKRSIDVGDGNYPAALLAEDWHIGLFACQAVVVKNVFFFFFSVCWCVDSFKIYVAKIQAIEGLSSTIWGLGFVYFLANSTTLRTVLASIFLIFTRIPGEMLKFD